MYRVLRKDGIAGFAEPGHTEYLARLAEVGEAYRSVMGTHFPAMTMVQVVALVEDGAKVEIEASAVMPK